MAGGMHGRGMCGRGACMPCTAPQHYEIRSVSARAVRILLECILVKANCCLKIHNVHLKLTPPISGQDNHCVIAIHSVSFQLRLSPVRMRPCVPMVEPVTHTRGTVTALRDTLETSVKVCRTI